MEFVCICKDYSRYVMAIHAVSFVFIALITTVTEIFATPSLHMYDAAFAFAQKNITCQQHGDSVVCNGITYSVEETDTTASERFFIDLGVSIALTLIAGLLIC